MSASDTSTNNSTSAAAATTAVPMETDASTSTPLTLQRTATWSFVQMNMSLLPIAPPLQVTTVCHRFQESFQTGQKPRTPTQKLHRRVQHSGANISPRRLDGGGGTVRRLSNTGVLGQSSSSDAAAAAGAETSPGPVMAPASPASHPPLLSAMPAGRSQSASGLVRPSCKRSFESVSNSSGYASDSSSSASIQPPQPPLARSASPFTAGKPPLSRSVSLPAQSTTSDAPTYKGKRLLELLDEERRLCPDDRSAPAPSPAKRSRCE